MTTTLKDEPSLLRVAGQDSNLEAFCVNDTALCRAEHLLPRDADFFNRAVIELVEFAFKRYNNVFFTVLTIDSLQLHLCGGTHSGRILNEGIGGAEEALKDLIVITLVSVTGKFVLTFGHSVLQTVLSILVIDAFHGGICEDLVGLAQLREALVCLGFLLSWIAHGVILQGQVAEGFSDLFTVGSGFDSERCVVSRLIVVHLRFSLFSISV